MKKIGEMGLAPPQLKITEKNPLVYFGDLITNKHMDLEKRKNGVSSLQVIVMLC
jgi:hypothetical protein